MSVSADPFAKLFANRAVCWRLRNSTLEFGRRPRLMGIVNVTPDSFSDGGKFFTPEDAVEHALQLAADGADILDIGGESTRPYADPVEADEELNRILPVLEAVSKRVDVPISIDTSKSTVARAALAAGAQIINDVTGLEGDPEMLEFASGSGAAVCIMHMQGSPQTMQDDPSYNDVVQDVSSYLYLRREALIAAGIAIERICLDPGIGFGKTHQHNLKLMANCSQLHQLGCPILVGHSRKGFLGKILGDKSLDRSAVTIGAALSLACQGVQVLRVHDVRSVREALLAFEAVGGIDGNELQLAD